MLGHKESIGKFKKTQVLSNVFSRHNTGRLEIKYKKKKNVKNTNTRRLKNMLLNNQWITEEIKEKILKKNT